MHNHLISLMLRWDGLHESNAQGKVASILCVSARGVAALTVNPGFRKSLFATFAAMPVNRRRGQK